MTGDRPMARFVPPPAYVQAPDPHPDLPECGEDEDYVDYLGRVFDFLTETPPVAPPGFVLIPCEAKPRHFPEYRVAEDVFYPAPCSQCQLSDAHDTASRLRCEADHRRWKSWRILGWLSSKAYSLGVIAGCGTSYGLCEFCGIGRQHMRPRWKGGRNYVLGVGVDTWDCLRRGHRRRESVYSRGLCTVCLPCPECGSSDPEHFSCESAC